MGKHLEKAYTRGMKKKLLLLPLALLLASCVNGEGSSLTSTTLPDTGTESSATSSATSETPSSTTSEEPVKEVLYTVYPENFPTMSSGYPEPGTFDVDGLTVSYENVSQQKQDGHDTIQMRKETSKLTLSNDDCEFKVLEMTLYEDTSEWNPYRAHLHVYDEKGNEIPAEVTDKGDKTWREIYYVDGTTSSFLIENSDTENARAANIFSITIATYLY